jgi:hypothetical protein
MSSFSDESYLIDPIRVLVSNLMDLPQNGVSLQVIVSFCIVLIAPSHDDATTHGNQSSTLTPTLPPVRLAGDLLS